MAQTWNQQMNQWGGRKKRSLISRIFLPDPDQKMSNRLIGFFWRLLLFIGLPLFIALYLVNSQMTSPEMKKGIETAIRDHLGAESVEVERIAWSNTGGAISKVTITGKPDSILEEATASSIRLSLPWRSRFSKNWEIDRVSIGDLSIRLRGAPSIDAEVADPATLRGGFGINPNLPETAIHYVQVSQLEAIWGDTPYNLGHIQSSRARMVPRENGWEIELTGGSFKQNWIKNSQITSIKSVWDGSTLKSTGDINFPTSGTGHLDIAFQPQGMKPTGTIDLSDVAVRDLIDSFYRLYFSGTCSGRVSYSGSVEPGSEVTTEGELAIKQGYCQGLPFFERLGAISLNRNLGKLPIDGGTLAFKSYRGSLPEVSLKAKIGSIGHLDAKATMETQEFNGTAQLDIFAFVFRSIPEVRDAYFQKIDDKKWSTTFPLQGSVDRWFGQEAKRLDRVATLIEYRKKGLEPPAEKEIGQPASESPTDPAKPVSINDLTKTDTPNVAPVESAADLLPTGENVLPTEAGVAPLIPELPNQKKAVEIREADPIR